MISELNNQDPIPKGPASQGYVNSQNPYSYGRKFNANRYQTFDNPVQADNNISFRTNHSSYPGGIDNYGNFSANNGQYRPNFRGNFSNQRGSYNPRGQYNQNRPPMKEYNNAYRQPSRFNQVRDSSNNNYNSSFQNQRDSSFEDRGDKSLLSEYREQHMSKRNFENQKDFRNDKKSFRSPSENNTSTQTQSSTYTPDKPFLGKGAKNSDHRT